MTKLAKAERALLTEAKILHAVIALRFDKYPRWASGLRKAVLRVWKNEDRILAAKKKGRRA